MGFPGAASGLGASLILIGAVAACRPAVDESPVGAQDWLTGDGRQKFETVARHLRGNDVVMWEVEYRYHRLFEAGIEENWEYAAYQLGKIRLVMEQGVERRPRRALSYEWFFENGIPPMERLIREGDASRFRSGFETFTQSCITCHGMERVEYIPVRRPAGAVVP